MHNSTPEFDRLTDPDATFLPAAEPTAGANRTRDLLAMQRAVVAMGRRAIAPPDVSVLMQDAAALLAEMLETACSGVAELSADGKRLYQRLALDAGGGSEPEIVVRELGASGSDSLAGYVLQVAHPVVVAELPREKRFTDLLLRKHGIQSAVAAPLQLQDHSFGSLATYSRHAGYFDDEDLPFVETIAHLVATTIARSDAERSLAEERRLSSGLLQTVDALVFMLDNQWRIVRSNPACARITGFSPAEIETRSMWSVFGDGGEAEPSQHILAKLQAKVSPVEYEADLVTKHSGRRRMAWSFTALFDGEKAVQWILAAGIDVTGQREVEKRAQHAQRMGEEARQGPQPAAADRQIGAFGLMPIPLNAERRRRQRRSYPYSQMIAPIINGKLPGRDQFFAVECNDIAASGFSFLSTQPPSYDCLVVALGVPPKVTYLTAQIAHVTRVTHNRQRMFLTGCNYTGRAAY